MKYSVTYVNRGQGTAWSYGPFDTQGEATTFHQDRIAWPSCSPGVDVYIRGMQAPKLKAPKLEATVTGRFEEVPDRQLTAAEERLYNRDDVFATEAATYGKTAAIIRADQRSLDRRLKKLEERTDLKASSLIELVHAVTRLEDKSKDKHDALVRRIEKVERHHHATGGAKSDAAQ